VVYGKAVASGSNSYTEQWLGITYANASRWTIPQLAQPVSGNFTEFGPACLQGHPKSKSKKGLVQSEDCLQLNVFRPAHKNGVSSSSSSSGLPVLFFVHGGGKDGSFSAGSSSLYPADSLAARDIMVVTFNYRLSVLGFLSSPEMGKNVNFGLRDQITALQWVRENIRDFGGDPTRITVSGQGAGAGAVAWLYANPTLSFVAAAIAQSPGPWSGVVTRATSDSQFVHAAALFNCSSLQCMRDLPAPAVTAVLSQQLRRTGNRSFSPLVVVDQDTVRGGVLDVFGGVTPLPNRSPLLLGSTSKEGHMFAFAAAHLSMNMSQQQYNTSLTQLYGPKAAEVSSWLAPTVSQKNYFEAFSAMQGQQIVNCGADLLAKAAAGSQARVYAYIWGANTGARETLPQLGAFHGSDLHFVFGRFVGMESPPASALPSAALQFATGVVQPIWREFVKTQSSTTVPLYNDTNPATMLYFSENFTTFNRPPEPIWEHHWDLCHNIDTELYKVQ